MCGEQAGLGKEGSRRKGRHVGGAWGAELRSGMEAQDAGVARLGCPFPETHGWYEGGVVALGDDVPVLKEGGGVAAARREGRGLGSGSSGTWRLEGLRLPSSRL